MFNPKDPTHKFQTKLGIGLLLYLIVSSPSVAEEVYKSIENGVVQYSTIPPTSNDALETISIFPEPSEEDIRAAQQDLKKRRENLEKRAQSRQEEPQAEESDQDSDSVPKPSANPLPPLTPFL